MTALWLRSVRQRPSTAVLLCLLSSVAVLTSMLGPVLVRAVHQSTLAEALQSAGRTGTSLSVSGDVASDEPYDQARGPALEVLTDAQDTAAAPVWNEARVLIVSTTNINWLPRSDAVGIDTLVSALDSDCTAYVITSGTCPTRTGQAMLSSVDATAQRVKVGDRITFTLARAAATTVRVVGLYDPVASTDAGVIRPGTTAGVLAGIKGDPLVVTTAQSTDLALPVKVTARMTARADLTVAEVAALQDSIESIKLDVNAQDRLLALQTDLPDLLDRVSTQAAAATVLILVTDVQALFLAIFALAIVLQRIGRARMAEWSVGRLRGVPRIRWLRSVYAEPLAALLLGLPLGFAAGVGVARLAVSWVLRPDTPVEWARWPVLAAAAAAALIAIGALVVVSLRNVRQPLAELVQQQAEGRRLGVVGAVVQSGVLLLAVATLYQLVTGGQLGGSGAQLALLAPVLLALAVALLAVRIAVVVVRRITTRPPRTLSALVVGRHAARTPSTLNPAMIIAVGVALTVFAVQIFAFSVRNQGLRADAITGASTVLTVSVPTGKDLLTVVRAADPEGRQAMAVQETAVGDAGGSSRIVAVDSTRLAAVTSWSPSWANVDDVGRALRGAAGPAITLRGSRVEMTLADVRVQPQPLPNPSAPNAVDPPPPPELVLTVDTGGRWQTVRFGRLAQSAKIQRLSTDLPCTTACRIVSLGLAAGTNAPYKAAFTVTSIATDQIKASVSEPWLRSAGRWRVQSINDTVADPSSTATPKASAAGLVVEAYDLEGGNTTSISPTDVVDPLPAVLAPGTSVEPVPGTVGAAYGAGLDGQQQKIALLGQASVLPRSLDQGVLVDLYNARGLSDPENSKTISEVWLAPGAGPALDRQLVAQGLVIQNRQYLATARSALEGQATTRGAGVAVIISSAALLLTLLALVSARWADAGRRGADWRALREGGISPRRLRHLVRVEIAVPAVLGVLVGLLSGAGAARIAGARLPLVDLSEPGPPLDLHLSWTPILLLGLGTVLVILVIAHLGAVAETRAGRLR